MDIICKLLIGIYFLNFIRNLIWCYIEGKKVLPAPIKESILEKVYIVIPMLDEQSIAVDTYEHFRKFLDKQNYHVVYVTTNKEKKYKYKKKLMIFCWNKSESIMMREY